MIFLTLRTQTGKAMERRTVTMRQIIERGEEARKTESEKENGAQAERWGRLTFQLFFLKVCVDGGAGLSQIHNRLIIVSLKDKMRP